MVATPDGDIYEESMSRHDPDVNNIWLVPAGGGLPPGLPAQRHDWGQGGRRALSDALKAEYIEDYDAEQLGKLEDWDADKSAKKPLFSQFRYLRNSATAAQLGPLRLTMKILEELSRINSLHGLGFSFLARSRSSTAGRTQLSRRTVASVVSIMSHFHSLGDGTRFHHTSMPRLMSSPLRGTIIQLLLQSRPSSRLRLRSSSEGRRSSRDPRPRTQRRSETLAK